MGRAPCCDKANVKRGPWSPEEDHILKSYIHKHGTAGNWIALPQKIGLKRCGKSCRLRWLNYLRPNIKHGGFTEDEDTIICSLYVSIGSRWSIIAAQLPGRTDNDIKNYWNTRLKKKLFGKSSIKESFSLYPPPDIEAEFCYDDDQGRIYEAQYQFGSDIGIDFPPLDGVPHVTAVDVGGSSTMSSSSLQNLNATSIVYPQSALNNYQEICYQEIDATILELEYYVN